MNRCKHSTRRGGCTALVKAAAVPLVLVAAVVLHLPACIPVNPGESPPDLTGPVSYAFDIQPIWDKRCVICHRPGGFADDIAGVNMFLTSGASYNDLVNVPSEKSPDWVLVVAGDPEDSLLYRKVADRFPPVGLRMPLLQPPLSDAEITLIREWIAAGAPQN